MKERNQSIDLVKIIAMMMVLLLHTGVIRGWSGGYGPVPEVYQIAGIAIAIAVEYLTASSVIILVSLAITRIPYMDRIFRI